MRKAHIGGLVAMILLVIIAVNCKKSSTNPEDEWKLSPDNKFEKPLASLTNSNHKDASNASVAAYVCGNFLTGNYYGVGYYTYPDYAINLSGTPLGSTIGVLVHSYDVPNRFTIKTTAGVTVASTSWMGHVTYAGPWGPSLNTPETQNLTFALGTTTSFVLKVETSTTTFSDNWDATITCTPPITKTYAGVTITYEPFNNILRFNSASDANAVLNQLEADYDTYNDNYDAQYPNYTAAQLDDADVANNFDEFKKYKDFEALFTGYSSMRKQIEITENAFLANNGGTDPDDIDFSLDDAENTIFNTNYSFKIGQDVYQLRADGIYLNGVSQDQNARISSPDCFSRKKIGPWDYPGDGKRYRLKVAVHTIIIRGSAKGKVVVQKPSGNSWKPCRSEMAVHVGGNIYTPQVCALNYSFTKRKPITGFKKRRRLKVKQHEEGITSQIRYKTKVHEMTAIYELPSGYSAAFSL